MKDFINGIGLLLSATLYFLAYQAYWQYSNMRPWLSEMLMDAYFFFSYPEKPESVELTVQATGDIVIFEDKVIFYSFILSLLVAIHTSVHFLCFIQE